MHCRNSFFPLQVNLCSSYEGNPLSPKKGEATQGEHLLDPHVRGIFINLPGAVTFWGMPWRRGRKHDVLEPPGAIFEENVFYLFIKLVARMCLYPNKNHFHKNTPSCSAVGCYPIPSG